METFGLIAKMTGALSIILGILFLSAYLLKRFGLVSASGGKGLIEVVENKALMPKRHLSLVRVAGRYFLIGSTDQSVTLLGSLDSIEVEDFGRVLTEAEERMGEKEPGP